MSFRRIVGVVLLVGLVGGFFPSLADADPIGEVRLEVRSADPGFFSRVLERLELLITQLTQTFVAREGASIGTNG